ncbi:catechol 2,3-dioxygenase-like lactoylglutathione lyase family enzyme [Saccharothrix tamanrassetensis]|uniref:Catechol 2,3-dioxygenase-like lactoylglutathione lyase family enzyme n=1 Tax=Saccharothrix tamanrassetensis TaxID=1051531 RepID=A0A841CEN7_9PSEU|nr:VOC family protein [Saccharothrix tamanrassetensis]MBB5954475.1 catechol 2,3-dioxygenase-like lactoylglutathione lyase family enzyme [Saccharothrix tamanrassetensis]
MTVKLNHTIVSAHDAQATADFLVQVFGFRPAVPFGPFLCVETDNEVSLDIMSVTDAITPQHYAFLVSDAEFDRIFDRVRERGLPYWADPFHREPGVINTNDGGRGVYFEDPNGHNLEIITVPYGG